MFRAHTLHLTLSVAYLQGVDISSAGALSRDLIPSTKWALKQSVFLRLKRPIPYPLVDLCDSYQAQSLPLFVSSGQDPNGRSGCSDCGLGPVELYLPVSNTQLQYDVECYIEIGLFEAR